MRVLGYQDIADHAHARSLIALVNAYGGDKAGVIYSEPVMPSNDLAPDLVLMHPELGVIVFEVKAYEVGYIQGIEAGNLKIRRNGTETLVNPLRQAQRGMYAIKNAYEQVALGDVNPLFNAMVILPNINESAWQKAGYDACIQRRLILFSG